MVTRTSKLDDDTKEKLDAFRAHGVESTESVKLNRMDLPEQPRGWTRRMALHLNFGSDGGGATFDVFTPSGKQAPFGYQYDTRKGGLTGFTVPGVDGVMSWAELREFFAGLPS